MIDRPKDNHALDRAELGGGGLGIFLLVSAESLAPPGEATVGANQSVGNDKAWRPDLRKTLQKHNRAAGSCQLRPWPVAA